MTETLPSLPEFRDVDRARFESEVVPRDAPAILRGLAARWPAVAHGRESPMAIARYLAGFDQGHPSAAVLLPPEEEGRLAYDAAMDGFNFMRTPRTVTQVLEQVLRYARHERAPAVAMQSARVDQCLPGFAAMNPMPLLDAGVQPRAWIGSAIITPAHFDESHNIAVCVAGRRRFTLFAPEQVANLYVGPLDNTPAGMPMSLVDFAKPDLERFPRFREALANAQVAELAPGDAIYIPPLWWHHVRSLERFNMLVNYWWLAATPGRAVPPFTLDALMHAAATVRALPPAQRDAWRHLFEHFVFTADAEAVAHIPADRQGVLGTMSAEDHAKLRKLLSERLGR
ncbi:MAG: cupin-like domain-containing protein [Vitreoscilla sp.]